MMARTYSQQKAALTRAERSKDPERVLAEVARTYAEWDTLEHGWPDGWHRWNVAKMDAEMTLTRDRWNGGR